MKKIDMKKIRCRALSGLLAAAMILPMVPASFAASAVGAWPVKMHVNTADSSIVDPAGVVINNTDGELPTLIVEANGVIDESNKLTGYVEIALRVKPGVLYFDDADTTHTPLAGKADAEAIVAAGGTVTTEVQPFKSASVVLRYNGRLEPWEWEKLDKDGMKADPATNPAQAVDLTTAVDKGPSVRGMVETAALHKNTRIGQVRVSAFSDTYQFSDGTTTIALGNNDGITGNDGGYLYLSAENFTADDFTEGDTVTVVARFKYTKDATDDSNNPWSTDFAKGASNPDAANWIDPTSPDCLVRLATQAELDAVSDPVAKYPIMYDSGKSETYPHGNGYYWSDDPTDGRGAFDLTLTPGDPGYFDPTYNLMDDPTTPWVDTTVTPQKANTTFVVPGRNNFTLVNKLSYNSTNADPREFVTIHFYDWDDTSLGTVIVKRSIDTRERVNNYVRENFIYTDGNNVAAGDDTNLSLQDNTAATISSLARTDNYRGKYDYAAPAPDPAAPVVADGGDYALTNKLDYVFFKRPMENNEATKPDETDTAKYPQGTADPAYIEDLKTWESTEYIQETDAATGDPVWDEEYPYIHGWALIPQGEQVSAVWTTMGRGELSSYTDYTDVTGGATTNAGAPAELSVDGGELSFADFDFSENPVPATINELAVKAVYEPGEDLLSEAFQYRQIKEPYYNKFNNGAAAAGGSYEAQVTFERADDTQGGNVRGVARMREPYVRQDTTTDLRWEEVASKGVNHDLPLTTNSDAYGGTKPTSSFVKVDITNTEEITFSLALSARHNKVDYFLRDGYGDNFVTGPERILTDGNRTYPQAVLDNYNYYIDLAEVTQASDASDTTDNWYDAKLYTEREGTHGFVLYGTLHSLMEQATKMERGDIDSATYNGYVSVGNLADANLMKADGTPAQNVLEALNTFNPILRRAARLAIDAHNNNDDTWWNTERDCAELSYHQLQWFITDYQSIGTSATLRTEAQAYDPANSATTITWCHLHQSCQNASSGKPTTWADLINKADLGADADLKKLSASDIETYFHLRKNGSGTEYATADVDAFANNMIAAVAALKGAGVAVTDITWDQVQYYLDKGAVTSPVSDMDAYGKENYWWYDGTKNADKTPTNWTQFELAVKAASSQNLLPATTTLPDGQAVNGRPAKLNQLKTAFDDDKDTTKSSQPWYSATHNLCAAMPGVTDGEGVRFNTFDDFKAAAIDAWEAAHALATPVDNPSWKQVQYHIIHKGDAGYPGFPADDAATQPESDGYWWYDGGTKINDVGTLLAAANKANNGDTSALDALTVADITNFAGLQFRVGFNGTTDVVTTANFAAFKTNVMAIEAAHGQNLTWEQLQYLLIHGTNSADPTNGADNYRITTEAGAYYWWKNKGDGSGSGFVPTLTVTDVKTLMEAAYRAKANGNPHAWDNLTAAAQLADVADSAATTSSSFRLVKGCPSGAVNFSDLTAYGDSELGTVKTALEDLYSAVATVGTETYNSLTWYQVQHYLITNTYLTATDTNLPNGTVYWWKENAADPSQVAALPAEDFGKMLNKMTDYVDDMMAGSPNGITIQTVLDAISDTMWNNMGFVGWDSTNYQTETITAANKSTVVDANFLDAESSMTIGYGTYYDWTTMKADLTWYQIQDAIINGSMYYSVSDPVTAYYNVTGMGITQPSWADTYWPDGMNKSTTDFIPMTVTPGSNDPAVVLAQSGARVDWLLRQIEEDPDFLDKYGEELDSYLAKVEELKNKVHGEKPAPETPVETPEVPVETPMEPEEPTESPEPEETESPEPEETESPSPAPEVPEEPTETPDPEETESPSPAPEVPEIPEEPTETPDPERPSPAPEIPEGPGETTDPEEPDETTDATDPDSETASGSDINTGEELAPAAPPEIPEASTGASDTLGLEAPGGVTLAQSFRMQRARKLLREKVPWTYGGPPTGERSGPRRGALIAKVSLERKNTSSIGGTQL